MKITILVSVWLRRATGIHRRRAKNLRLERGVQMRVSHLDHQENHPLDFGGWWVEQDDGSHLQAHDNFLNPDLD